MTVRNRLLQTAHSKLYSTNGGESRRNLDYHVARARGGIGLIITDERLVHPSSPTGRARFTYAYLQSSIATDQRLTDAVHHHGAAIFAQLNHVGLEATSDGADDLRVLYGPSAVRSPMLGEAPKVMEAADIQEVCQSWGHCAANSREGGFDGVELHVAHGYLLSQFLSPLYNHREDEYGGSVENRTRFTREAIASVRAAVGNDFVVGVRLGLTEFVPGGLEIDDALEIAALLLSDSQIDFLDTSGGGYHSGQHMLIGPSDIEGGWLVERAARLKAAVGGFPVFAVGGLNDPDEAEQIIASGQADMVAMTRGQIADPQLPNKLRAGRPAEVYRCIRGNQGCISRVWRGLPMGCTVNPETGREGRFGSDELPTAATRENWLVIGGGPGGLKAAETLERRGHAVALLERDSRLGGQVNLIAQCPGRASFLRLVQDLERHLRTHGVTIELETPATVELVQRMAPDHVIIATGAVPLKTGYSSVAPTVLTIPGVDLDHVLTGWEILAEPERAGSQVAILDDDGTRQVAGIAELLLDTGRRVELVSRWTSLLPFTVTTLDQPILYKRLFRKGLAFTLNSWVREITSRDVRIYDLYSNAERVLTNVDTVVVVAGARADDELYFALKRSGVDVARIGDCTAPRTIDHAIYEGYLAGRELLDTDTRFIAEGELEGWEEAATASVGEE